MGKFKMKIGFHRYLLKIIWNSIIILITLFQFSETLKQKLRSLWDEIAFSKSIKTESKNQVLEIYKH